MTQRRSNPLDVHDREGTGFERKEGGEKTQRNRVECGPSGVSELPHSLWALETQSRLPTTAKYINTPMLPPTPATLNTAYYQGELMNQDVRLFADSGPATVYLVFTTSCWVCVCVCVCVCVLGCVCPGVCVCDHYNCFTKEETAVQSGVCVCVIIITLLCRRRNCSSEMPRDLFNEQGRERGLKPRSLDSNTRVPPTALGAWRGGPELTLQLTLRLSSEQALFSCDAEG